LVAVIENAMARDPDHRFQSAAAMLHALDHHTFDHDVLSRTSNPEVTVPVMANPPTLVLEAQPADQPRTPRQDAPRRPALVLILAGAVVALLVALAVLLALDDSPAGSPAPGTATIASTLPSTRAGPVGAGLPSSLEHSLEQLERSVGR
ncbi:MAG TPA: hypothetical protein VGA11_02250, partial [Acidimicrobiia bacterium]